MMFGLTRLHFIREEDKLCAKLGALFILSGLQRASGDSGKQCSVSTGGAKHIRDWAKRSQAFLYVVHTGP